MKSEMMGLWGILLLSTHYSIKKLIVASVSTVTIDWINEKSNLDLIYLSYWKEKVSTLKKGFGTINFMHIHRQFNKVADNLSKKALNDTLGWLFFEELGNGSTVRSGELHIL
jgi:hypothetical protein